MMISHQLYDMNKKLIRLAESDLHKIIKESVKRILIEQSDKFETYYRGYNSKYGSQRDHMFWITDDISYARRYGNRVEEIIVDENKLKLTSIYGIEEIVGYEFDPYEGLNEEDTKLVLAEGYNGYYFYVDYDIVLVINLFSLSPIISRRELTKEEFDAIELFDDCEYKQYDDDYDRW